MSVSVRDAYEAKYGLGYKAMLRMLGGDPDKIIDGVQHQMDNPDEIMSLLHNYAPTVDDYASSAQGLLIREIKRIYFQSIPRSAVVAICNTLNSVGLSGTINIHKSFHDPELEYNSFEFMNEWNKNHPDEKPIEHNPGLSF